MKTIRLHPIFVAILICTGSPLVAQEESSEPQEQQKAQDASSVISNMDAVYLSTVMQENQDDYIQVVPQLIYENRRLPILYSYFSNDFASDDGEYLAQSKEELQTYYDLGMTYQYIEKPYLRAQLQLPNEQGIIVATTKDSGEGHKNGFRSGDIVLTVGETAVDTQYDLVQAIALDRGEQKTAAIRRDGEPMELVLVMSELKLQTPTRLILGVSVDEIDDLTRAQLDITGGTAITHVTDDGPAKSAGLLEHDIITTIDGSTINNIEDLRAAVQKSKGEPVSLAVVRMGKALVITVAPKEVPIETSVISATEYNVLNYSFPHTARLTTDLYYADAIGRLSNLAVAEAAQADADSETTAQKVDRILEQLGELKSQLEALKGSLDK